MTHNGKLLKDLDDFIVYDKNQHDEILKTERKIKQQEELHLIIRENYIYITKNEARKIFSKYKIDKNIIEIQKSVKIISFNRFKKENPITMKQFINHQNDSIILSNYNKGDLIFTNRKKINW
ncbi:hypothetical protein HYN56_23870 [Flavobacterium crocinum]|uniref:Uncharacterized protein n=1 Tax=Flavobacterium crocinum TaxID=2183896 RepID=A0A2S1YSX3_9FLAO|nr:hypothetical protein [Flavobacterium crocinum]AWK07102.1 hypothetical protein HYN56_23870 [Flavobacterium crocinum]